MLFKKFRRKDKKKLYEEKLLSMEVSLKSLDKSILYLEEQCNTLKSKNLGYEDYIYQKDFLDRKINSLKYEREVLLGEIEKFRERKLY